MQFTLAIPTYRRYDTLKQCLETASKGTRAPDAYVIMDNGQSLAIEDIDETIRDRTFILRPDYNLGVAPSWNAFLMSLHELIVIANDDVMFLPDTLEKLVGYAEDHPEVGFMNGSTTNAENTWSLFIHRKWLFDLVGPYDTRFWPAYYEDNDMHYRMRLAGHDTVQVPGCVYEHVGSATLKSYSPEETEEHHHRFRINQAYYIEKWGGLPGQEQYRSPFNV